MTFEPPDSWTPADEARPTALAQEGSMRLQ
jgi:hypothetical protein